jgi:hypothetical protein
MYTIHRLFLCISGLAFLTGSSLFPIADILAQAEAAKGGESMREKSQMNWINF